MNNLQAQYVKEYGPGNYIPNVFIQYWGMRVMAYLAAPDRPLRPVGAVADPPQDARDVQVVPAHRPLGGAPPVPHEHRRLAADRERPPTVDRPGPDEDLPGGVPSVTAPDIWISLTVFVLLYAALGVADAYLMVHYGRQEPGRGADEAGAATATATAAAPATADAPAGDADEQACPGAHLLGGDDASQQHLVLIVAIFWVGFFVLEGFDFGVGMLHSFVGKNDAERRIAVNSIGPIWDGNEVWLIVGGAAIFAAFPSWYATMFSTFYLALVVVLVALIVRGRLLRVQPQGRRSPVASRPGGGRSPSGACSSPCCSAPPSATCFTGSRSTRPTTTPASSSACSCPSGCTPGSP